MKNFQKFWSGLALAGAFLGGGGLAMANAPKLPEVMHDTIFYDNFNDESTHGDWKFLDENGDGNTWLIGQGEGIGYSNTLRYSGNGNEPDDWAFSKGFELQADRVYKLSYFGNSLYYPEKVRVYLCTGQSVEAVGQMLSEQEIDVDGWAAAVFTVEQAGTYYLGFEVASEPVNRPGLYIDEVSVTEEVMGATPRPVQNLKQVPGANGALTMGLSWTNPSQDEAGGALSELTAIEIYKNYGNENIAGSLNLQPGAHVSWTDPDPQAGKVTYHVYAVNASGRSYAAMVNTYVGEDLPSAPKNLKATIGGGNVSLSWEAPSEFGLNGGWYDKSDLTYLVARRGQNYSVLASSSTAMTYTDAAPTLDMYYYEVTAKNGFGQGGKAVSEPLTPGTSMVLPFHEDFEDPATLEHLWTVVDVDNDKATWYSEAFRGNKDPKAVYWNYLPAINPYGDDPTPEADDYLFSPMMQFEAGKTYRLSYALAGPMFGSVSLRVTLSKAATPEATQGATLIASLNEHATNGAMSFEAMSHEFTPAASGSFCISFYYYGFDGNGYCWLDDITVEEVAENDLAVNYVKGMSAPKVGEASVYTVQLENKGTGPARNYKLQLLDDAGNVLVEGSEVTRPLVAGRTSEVELEWTPANANLASLMARVVWADDEVEGNNTSPMLLLNVQGEGFKAVAVGDGEVRSDDVPWYVYTSGFGQTVYPSSLMEGLVGKIQGFSWQVRAGLEDTARNQKMRIYMGETDRIDMMAGWFGPDELLCVLDTVLDIVPGNYEWYLPLQRPLDYKGGNLVVCVEGYNDYSDLGGGGLAFLCTESGANAVSRSNRGNYAINMQNLDNTKGQFFSLRPNVMFYFDIKGMGGISGTVTGPDGNALENVKVEVDGMNNIQRTLANGTYEFPYVPEGKRDVAFTAVGYEDANETVSVSEGQTATLDVKMQSRPLVKVSGVVAGSDDPHTGLALAELTLDGPSDYKVTTDENGCFTIEEVYGNLTYNVLITASGYSDYSGTLEVGATDLIADTIWIDRMVNMPSFVRAYDRTDHALVEWEEPVPVAWLQKDDGNIYGSFGGNSDAAYIVAQRYTPEDIAEAGVTASAAVTKVRFFPMAVADFTLQIFMGEEGVESLVHEEAIEVDEYEAWFEYDLEEPVAIDPSKSLIVGLKIQQSSGSNPVGFDRGPAVLNGDLFSEDGGLTWVPVSSVSATMNYNWLIHTYCSANPNSQPNEVADLMSVRPGSGSSASAASFLDRYAAAQKVAMPKAIDVDSKPASKGANTYTVELLSRAERKALASKAASEPQAGAEYSYEVYRLLNGQEQDESLWVRITENPVTEMSVRDENWEPLQDTMWRYAVRSVLDGVYSDYTFSDAVDKGKYATASLKVTTNTGESAQGAIVSLIGLNNTHTDTVGADGLATISDVHFGTYELRVRKDWFNTYVRTGVVLDSATEDLGSVELMEDVRPPKNFTATDWIDYVDLAWDKPERMIEQELSKTMSDYYTGIGMNYGGTMEVGQRFTPEELAEAGVDGYYIRSITFWPDASADFTLKVWKSDYEGQEREFYSQAVSGDEITLGQWNTVELDEPVLVNAGQYYIIGYSAYMASGSYPCGADRGPLTAGGDLMFYEGEWSSFCSFAPSMYNFNWMIRALVANDANSQLKSLAKAEDGSYDYTYELYRLAQADSANTAAWTRLNGDGFKELSYKDESWASMEDGDYYYAVYSRSESGNTSDTVFSTLLPKGQVSLVTVSATTNNGASAAGASVELVSTDDEEQVYTAVLGEDASVQVPAVLKGNYNLTLNKFGFEEMLKRVSVTEDRQTLSDNVLEESLTPPAAVRAMKDENEQVRVDWWSAMTTESYPHYISWSTDDFFTGIGQGENAFNFSAAHKYTTFDLAEKKAVGMYVTKIRFYAASTPSVPTDAAFAAAIWEGENGETEILEKWIPYDDVVLNAWNEVVLDEPYYIDGTKTVFFGYICEAVKGWVGGIDKGPAVRGKGNMINVDGSWMTITSLSPDLDYNWMIEVYCTDAVEAGVSKSAKAESEDFVKSWSVYRLVDGQQETPSSWTELSVETTERMLTDNISGLDDDWYLYAVRAHYSTGNSDYAFSNVLGKGVGNETVLEDAAAMVVTPNPNHGRFSLEIPFEGEWQVFDMDGRLVMERHLTEGTHSMDVSLKAGSYLMVLVSGTRQATGKLVIL